MSARKLSTVMRRTFKSGGGPLGVFGAASFTSSIATALDADALGAAAATAVTAGAAVDAVLAGSGLRLHANATRPAVTTTSPRMLALATGRPIRSLVRLNRW